MEKEVSRLTTISNSLWLLLQMFDRRYNKDSYMILQNYVR